MNKKSDGSGLSSIELVVLARYSAGKKPSEAELSQELHRLGLAPESSAPLVRQTVSALATSGLLTPSLVRKPKGAKAAPPPTVVPVSSFQISDAGKNTLRNVFGVASAPSWNEVRDSYLPALALGLSPGSPAASEAGANLPMSMLRIRLKMPKDASLTDICNTLLLRRLGLQMSEITLASLRARVLADALNVKEITTPKQVVAKGMSNWVGTQETDKKSLVRALSRRWLADQSNHWLNGDSPGAVAAAHAPPAPSGASLPGASSGASSSISLDALADVVHDALPRIGTDGRYGSEKVFVSAVWRGLEKERRLPAMTLDSFKRNLVSAMRAGKLRLARADLIGAMDSKLVSESEISDNGSTFHFVVEQRSGNGRRAHV